MSFLINLGWWTIRWERINDHIDQVSNTLTLDPDFSVLNLKSNLEIVFFKGNNLVIKCCLEIKGDLFLIECEFADLELECPLEVVKFHLVYLLVVFSLCRLLELLVRLLVFFLIYEWVCDFFELAIEIALILFLNRHDD